MATTPPDELRGDHYTFMAIEQTTRLIIHWHIGKRSKENAMDCFNFCRTHSALKIKAAEDNPRQRTNASNGPRHHESRLQS